MSRKQLAEFFATFHACTVVMEACAGSHHMARKLAGFGHTVRLSRRSSSGHSSSQTRMISSMPRRSAKQRRARR